MGETDGNPERGSITMSLTCGSSPPQMSATAVNAVGDVITNVSFGAPATVSVTPVSSAMMRRLSCDLRTYSPHCCGSTCSSISLMPTRPRGSIVYIAVLARTASRVSSDSSLARSAAANSLPPLEKGLVLLLLLLPSPVPLPSFVVCDPSEFVDPPPMFEKRSLASLARDFEKGSKS